MYIVQKGTMYNGSFMIHRHPIKVPFILKTSTNNHTKSSISSPKHHQHYNRRYYYELLPILQLTLLISLDPYIGTNTNEIGTISIFHQNLTYPTPLTTLNVINEMRTVLVRQHGGNNHSYSTLNLDQDY